MIRRAGYLLLALALPLLLAGFLFHVSAAGQPPQPGKIGLALQERLQETPGSNVRFLVKLTGAADLSQEMPTGRAERRESIVQRLQETARVAQKDLLQDLAALQESGRVARYRPLWIVNAVSVEGLPDVPTLLAKRTDVREIVLDARLQYVQPLESVPYSEPEAGWNVSRIRGPHAWHGLGVRGEGVTVAIMDTGTDWTHPDLGVSYRGYEEGAGATHEGNWYDAVDASNQVPHDPHGHGTHVAGTVAGANGIGVAPGANWIAVRIFDEEGATLFSTVHEGFQWLLAPAGNPALAPDIVNGSWAAHGLSTEFLGDINALEQAGIVPVFAAGNDGPEDGTIGTPAAYTDTLAVAASDDLDEVAWFSSQGPSTFTPQTKPDMAAPGTNVYSTLPENAYGFANGTSMAAPHVSGAAALLLSVDPSQSTATVREALAETAMPLGQTIPDFSSGWGRIDAYTAAASRGPYGAIAGVIRGEAGPLPGATVTVTTPDDQSLPYTTDDAGRYVAWLQAGEYQVLAEKYGYAASAPQTVNVADGATMSGDLTLARLPQGQVRGRVTDAASQEPVRATISVLSTPVTAAVDAAGFYTVALPAGQSYILRVEKAGYRVHETTVSVSLNGDHRHDFTLQAAPSILLVDSGRWYYDSRISYYRQALTDAGYGFDVWTIRNPEQAPRFEEMAPYDLVIWSSPQDAPGSVRAGTAINEYLDDGGKLLVSGQNVARLDGYGPLGQGWWHSRLEGIYLGTATPPFVLSGLPETAFADLNLGLNGPDSAQNQGNPTRVGVRDGSLSRPVLAFAAGEGAALHSGWCRPYEIVFFGFGLEGVSTAEARAGLVTRSLTTVTAPPVAAALSLEPEHHEGIVLAGETVTYSLRLRNLSEVQTTTISLDLQSSWDASVISSSMRLGPCASAPVTVTLQVPPDLPTDSTNVLRLQARAENGSNATATINNKTPAQYLLVDDHRWYDQVALYEQLFDGYNLNHDVWTAEVLGSPRPELLQAYDMVFWYTAYDWFDPINKEEGTALVEYLDDGGRLFLSSQDYLYYNLNQALTRHYLGVLDYTESVTPTAVLGGAETVVGEPAGPFVLSYDPYQNFSDGLTPAAGAQVHLWNNRGTAAGLATARQGWRSIFWSFPLETLPSSARERLFGRILGWLGDAGDSTLEMSPRIGPDEEPRHYTLTARTVENALPRPMIVTATVDPRLVVDTSSLTGEAVYDPATSSITWRGLLSPGAAHEITFIAQPDGLDVDGRRLDVTGRINYGGDEITWEKTVGTWVDVPDLTGSKLNVTPNEVLPGNTVTFTLRLDNDSSLPATDVSTTLFLPPALTPMTGTLSAEDGTVTLAEGRVLWQGTVGARANNTISLQLNTARRPEERFLATGAVIDDGVTSPIVRSVTLELAPRRLLFPLVGR